MTTTDTLPVEVAYASPERSLLLALEVRPGTTAREAVLQSALAAHFPEADFQAAPLGVFGKAVADDYVLQAHERVEVYRPLLIDPKENRRRRAAGG
ncbi:putative ubiquitin-RnfH superfamily antitoxin RatB of RatAB toxin-antitoxin module [Neisseria sp. HSC-16F19]|nr:RnfH family protein [Neisseria sp. HSC-16F19]MCP2039708.1 putative ubiquitin-RnfH superfamily antitoxin RatB of RatAB toxin-antitoxin module [Neisseria sp. HSC-16F19]